MSIVPASQQKAILNALGLNPDDPRVQALAMVAQRYGLDLLLRQIFLIQGTVYVSHAGLLSVAHRSGQLDGIEVDIKEQPDRWVAKATIWRKDMSRPFVYIDECRKNERQVADPRKRAITRAERNCLRRAFDVGVEVYDDDRPEPPAPPLSSARPPLPGDGGPHAPGLEASRGSSVPEPPSPSTLDARKSVVVRCRQMGLTDEERHMLVAVVTGGRTESTKELTQREASDCHVLLRCIEQGDNPQWLTDLRTATSTSSSPASSPSPAPASTSSTETPSGERA
jgi:hypothetical protein